MDSVLWLRVENEDIDAAELLRITVNKSTTGSSRKRRTSFVCTGTLHKGKDDHMREYARVQKKLKADPRTDEGLQLELQWDMMARFRMQKREREADNLADSEEDGDEGGENIPPSLHSPYAAPTLLSYTQPCAHPHFPFSRIAYLELLRRAARVEEGREEVGDGEHGPGEPEAFAADRSRASLLRRATPSRR